MARGASEALKTEIAKSALQPIHLIDIIFDDFTFSMTDAYKSQEFDGKTYLAYGWTLNFTNIIENTQFQISEITGTLSAVDQSLVSAYLNNQYIGRTVKIYQAALDTTDDLLISSPLLIFNGEMTSVMLQENPDDGSSVLEVVVSNNFSDFQRKRYRTTNNENLQFHFPGDKGFEFADIIIQDIKWGAL